jgi:hypothetical protein
VALALGTIARADAAEQAGSIEAQQLDELQRQVQQLQQELERMRNESYTRTGQASPEATQAPAPARATTSDPSIQAGPLTVTLGGFAELAAIYRNRNQVADVSSNFNTGIPYPNARQYHLSEFRASARQSRFSVLTQGPQEGTASAEAYLEMDFQSSAPTANSVESNSYNPRLRHFYATYRRRSDDSYMLAGQSYSLATLLKKGLVPRQEQIPISIDGQYVVGFNWTRNPQLRLVKNFANKAALGLSLESPEAIVFSGPNNPVPPPVTTLPGGSLFAPTTQYSVDVAPDVIAKVAWDPGFGHYEAYGLGRAFRDRAGQENHVVYGGGVGIGAILPLGPKLDLQFSGLAGRGIGRYGSAQLPDVAIKQNGALEPVSAYQALLGAIYRPSSDWTLYLYAGIEDAESRHYAGTVNGTTLGYGYGSPLYDNSGCEIEGSLLCAANTSRIEQATIGAWWKYYQGTLGNLQFGIMGSYTKRTAFEGIGGDPGTDMTVGMLSFRYYPYQR